jgi:hypothetical protein
MKNNSTQGLVAMYRIKQGLCQILLAAFVENLAVNCRFVIKKTANLRPFSVLNDNQSVYQAMVSTE